MFVLVIHTLNSDHTRKAKRRAALKHSLPLKDDL